MQKKIIALAIAGLSSAAFAQSNVTISGNVDMGYYSQSMGTGTIMDTKTFGASNGSSTSSLTFAGSEDLGGGMKAGFVASTDWTFGSNSATFLNSQNYLELAGTSWGSVKAGDINTAGLTAMNTAQPFSTAIGSGNSGAFGRLSRAGINGQFGSVANTTGSTSQAVANEGENGSAGGLIGVSGTRSIRVNNSVSYTSPTWSGFSFGGQFAARNEDSAVVAAGNTPGFTGLYAAYNNGPINVILVNEKIKNSAGQAAAAATGGIAGGSNTLGANETMTHNVLAGNYTFGAATVYGGWTSSKSSVASNSDARSWNIAGKYAFTSTVSGMVNFVKYDDKLAGNADRNLTGAGIDYAMSKRSTAYGRIENGDNNKNSVDGKFTRYQVGLRHAF